MPITIHTPDGGTIEFPDDTDEGKILEVMRRHYGSAAPPKAGFDPAKAESSLNASAGGFLQGLPIVGPALDEGANMAEAGLRTMWDGENPFRSPTLQDTAAGGTPYRQHLKQVEQAEQADQAANPKTAISGRVAGAVYGTAPLVMAAPEAFGINSAASLPANMAAGGLTNGLLSGTDAAVRSGGDLRSTATGAALGLGTGVFSPLLSAGAGRVADALLGPNDALSGLPANARRFAVEHLGPLAQDHQQALDRLGPLAVPADVSQEWLAVARGAAAQPGMRDAVTSPLLERAGGATQRINADLNTNFGPPVVPSAVNDEVGQNMRALGDEYGRAFAGSRAVDTQPIADWLDTQAVNLRGPAQDALTRVRDMLEIPQTGILDPNPATLHQTRMAIDGMMGQQAVRENPQVMRALTQARQMISQELQNQVPGLRNIDARYAELARQRDALQTGQEVFDTGRNQVVRPADFEQQMTEAAQPVGGSIQGPSAVPVRTAQGARAEIDRVVGTRPNDVQALRTLLQGEGPEPGTGGWNTQKLETLFGEEPTQNVVGAVNREHTFADTANRVARGSDTAMASSFNNLLKETSQGVQLPASTTALGALSSGGLKVLQAVFARHGAENARRIASELGRFSVAQGPERDALIQALAARAANPDMAPLVQQLTAATVGTGGRARGLSHSP